jgi:hypothetical protein
VRRALVPKILITVVALFAIVRVATARPPELASGKPVDEKTARDAYRDVTSRERSQRREAAVKFPGDPWSQDDDYHEREHEQMRSFATGHQARLSDVVRAVDDGMRQRWPTSVAPNPKVPPCRPRLSY